MFSQDVSIDSLIEKASFRALADVPTFGVRKIPVSDLIFAELIGESSEQQTIQKMASSLQTQILPREQSKAQVQDGGEMYKPKRQNYSDGLQLMCLGSTSLVKQFYISSV
jgi:hypothetical protein